MSQLERKYLVPCYNPDGVRSLEGLVFIRGKGCKLYDSKGKEYLDWAAGIAVNALGHSDAAWGAAITAQLQKVQHLSNLFHSWEPLHLAKALVESTAHFDKAFLCNSGTEANEAALKFARKVALNRAMAGAAAKRAATTALAHRPPAFEAFGCKSTPPSACFTKGGVCGCWPQASDNDVIAALKPGVIAFKRGFHGRSMGSLSATHKPTIRQPFGPFPPDVAFARYNNVKDVEVALERAGGTVGAIIVEPVQGEGGVYSADPGFMRALRSLATHSGALLIVDEIQCGLGRTGRLWAHEAYADAAPDMMTLAKPLAGGLPIGAVLVTDAVSSAIAPGDHGTTFGGNPLVAAAALEVFSRISDPAFLAASRARGGQLIAGMRALARRFPAVIEEVRSTADGGLFVGVQLRVSPKPLVAASLQRGLMMITAGDNALRLCPPLVISEAEVAWGVDLLAELIPQVYAAEIAKGVVQ